MATRTSAVTTGTTRVMDWIIGEFKKDSGIDLTKQPDAIQRIKEEAEKAKIALSSSQEYEINLPFITADASGPKHIQKKLTRSKLEQLPTISSSARSSR